MPRNTILAVDDEPLNLEILEELLGDEYDVVSVASGAEALACLPDVQPDIMLLDLMMPEMDGLEVCRRVRADVDGKPPKIILVSARSSTSDRLSGYEVGADDYLIKPFDHDELLAKVRVFLRLCSVEQLVEERAAANLALQEALDAAKAAAESKSTFLANMSHEIRTPMTAILGFAEVLRDQVHEPENVEVVQTVISNGNYLLRLLNDILDIARVESGKMQLEFLRESPFELLDGVCRLMRLRAEQKGVALNVGVEGLLPETIATDPTRLRQILLNIVGNAIKFTDDGKVEIVVSLESVEQESKILFRVIDTGIGIDADQCERIFEPFRQADGSTTRRYGGTGLGLTISKRLANMLGGDISVSSRVGEGSTFEIRVDTGLLSGIKLIGKPATGGSSDKVDPPATGVGQGMSNRRVLLAEDTPATQKLVMHILGKCGAKVSLACDGVAAIESFEDALGEGRPFDIVVMDLQMPRMDGLEATRRLRALGSDVPIVALTANAIGDSEEECLAAGCTAFETKPINKRRFLATLQRLLDVGSSSSAPVAR